MSEAESHLESPSPCPRCSASNETGAATCARCALLLRCPTCTRPLPAPMVTRICPHIDCQTRISQPHWEPLAGPPDETAPELQALLDTVLADIPSLSPREASAALGRRLFAEGRYQDAEAAFEAAQAEPGDVPRSADLVLVQGFCKVHSGATNAGLSLWLAALAEDPDRHLPLAEHILRRVNRGFAGEYGEWVLSTWLPHLRARRPSAADSESVLAILGLTALALARVEEANRWLTDAVDAAGERAPALVSTLEEVSSRWDPDPGVRAAQVSTAIARLWALVGREDRARRLIGNVLTLDLPGEDLAAAFRLRAELHHGRGDVGEAVADRREAGSHLMRAERYADALRDFAWVLERVPDDQETLWLASSATAAAADSSPVAERVSGLRRALEVWDRARALGKPQTVWPWMVRGGICWSLSAIDPSVGSRWTARAALAHENALIVSPDDPELWLSASVHYQSLEAAESAAMCLLRAEDLGPNVVHRGWGATQRLLHAFAYDPQRLPDLLAAYEQDPQHDVSTFWIVKGYLEMWAGRPEEAVRSLRRAVDTDAGDAYPHAGLARALFLAGKDGEALQEISRTRDLLSPGGTTTSQWWRAYCAAVLGDLEELHAVHDEARRDPFEARYAYVLLGTSTALARARQGDAVGAAEALASAAGHVRYAGDIRELWVDAGVVGSLLDSAGAPSRAIEDLRTSLRGRPTEVPSGTIDGALAEVERLLAEPRLAPEAQTALRARRASLLAQRGALGAGRPGPEAGESDPVAARASLLEAARGYRELLGNEDFPEAETALASCLRSLIDGAVHRPVAWPALRQLLGEVTPLLPDGAARPELEAAALEWSALAELVTNGRFDPAALGTAISLRARMGEDAVGIAQRWSAALTAEEYWRVLDLLDADGGNAAVALANHLRATLDERHRSDELLWWVVTLIVVEVGAELEDSAKELVDGGAIDTLRGEFQARYGILLPGVHFRGQTDLQPWAYEVQVSEVVRARRTIAPTIDTGERTRELLAGLSEVLVDHLDELLTLEAVEDLLGRWTEDAHGPLVEMVKEVRESPVAFTRLASVLRLLVAERVPLVDGRAILEGIRLEGGPTRPVDRLLRAVRRQLVHALPGNEGDRSPIDVPAEWEEAATAAEGMTPGPPPLATFEVLREIRARVEEQGRAVLVTHRPELRGVLARLVRDVVPDLPVLADDELRPEPVNLRVETSSERVEVEGLRS